MMKYLATVWADVHPIYPGYYCTGCACNDRHSGVIIHYDDRVAFPQG